MIRRAWFHGIAGFCCLLVGLGCARAICEVRHDRTLAEMSDSHGHLQMVLVSEKALEAAPANFKDLDESHWTEGDLRTGAELLLKGGTCQISGAKVPPMTPIEAKDFWISMVYGNGYSLRKKNPALPLDEAERQSRLYVSRLAPEIEALARQYDPALKLEPVDRDTIQKLRAE